jgi:hypothetical protein
MRVEEEALKLPAKHASNERMLVADVGVKSRFSDNVGGVKQFSSTLQHALEEERHFALVEEVLFQPRLAS